MMTTSPVFRHLSDEDQVLMEKFSQWLSSKKEAVDQTCIFLAGKVGGQDLVGDFKNFSDETKLRACLDYMAIGLVSGSIQKKDVENLFLIEK